MTHIKDYNYVINSSLSYTSAGESKIDFDRNARAILFILNIVKLYFL